MTYIKNPRRYIRTRLETEIGVVSARKVKQGNRAPNGTEYTLTTGRVVFVSDNISQASASSLLADIRKEAGVARPNTTPKVLREERTPKPVINLNRLVASKHAKLRYALMKAQSPKHCNDDELLYTLRCPLRAEYSPRHGSWIFVGEHISVAVVDNEGRTEVKTLLWSKSELWDAFPRPEKAGA